MLGQVQYTNPTALKINQALQPIENGANKFNTGMNNAITGVMGGDQYQAQSQGLTASTQGPAPQRIPLYQFFDDPNKPPHPLNLTLARRLSWFGVNDSQEFLQAANTPFKRTLISYLGGIFLNGQERQYLNYQISAWAGQSDLMRSGVSLQTARLMQVSGAGDIPTLTRYGNPIDKGVLFAAMGANALQYGYWMPSFGEVSSAIERSRNVVPIIQW